MALPFAFFFGFALVVLLLAFGESNLQLYFTARVITDANQQIADFAQKGMFVFDLIGSPQRNSRPR